MMRRRWVLVDQWTRRDGTRTRRVMCRHWTRWGAQLCHTSISPFLSSRGGQAAILLHDLRSGTDTPLSTS